MQDESSGHAEETGGRIRPRLPLHEQPARARSLDLRAAESPRFRPGPKRGRAREAQNVERNIAGKPDIDATPRNVLFGLHFFLRSDDSEVHLPKADIGDLVDRFQ